jgi:hypothetical protein
MATIASGAVEKVAVAGKLNVVMGDKGLARQDRKPDLSSFKMVNSKLETPDLVLA